MGVGAASRAGTGLPFEYAVRRSGRAKNIRINVSERGVEVVLPQRAAERHAHAFVRERRAWIERALDRYARHAELVAARELSTGAPVPYLGRELKLVVRPASPAASGRRGRAHADFDAGVVTVHSRPGRDHVADALEHWYRRRAREEVRLRLDAAVARNGTSYERIAIRDQRTRWGSCSTSGTLSFNWRLLLAPAEVLDYVVEHEAAHIEVRDHSPRFWALLDDRVPEWRRWRDWLREHGGTLRLS